MMVKLAVVLATLLWGQTSAMEELTDRTQAIMAAKTKGDVITIMLVDKDDADLAKHKQQWSELENIVSLKA